MSASKQWTEVYARQVIADWKRSGLSGEQFAKRMGITGQRLSQWTLNLGLRERSRGRVRRQSDAHMLPVRVVKEGPIRVESSRESVNVTMEVLLVDGTRIRFAETCSENAMRRLLSATR